MAYLPYKHLWESEFDNFVSIKEKVQDMNIKNLKLELHDS